MKNYEKYGYVSMNGLNSGLVIVNSDTSQFIALRHGDSHIVCSFNNPRDIPQIYYDVFMPNHDKFEGITVPKYDLKFRGSQEKVLQYLKLQKVKRFITNNFDN